MVHLPRRASGQHLVKLKTPVPVLYNLILSKLKGRGCAVLATRSVPGSAWLCPSGSLLSNEDDLHVQRLIS